MLKLTYHDGRHCCCWDTIQVQPIHFTVLLRAQCSSSWSHKTEKCISPQLYGAHIEKVEGAVLHLHGNEHHEVPWYHGKEYLTQLWWWKCSTLHLCKCFGWIDVSQSKHIWMVCQCFFWPSHWLDLLIWASIRNILIGATVDWANRARVIRTGDNFRFHYREYYYLFLTFHVSRFLQRMCRRSSQHSNVSG